MVTFRRYGVSAWETGRSLSWGEACDLLDAAMQDTGTEVFAAIAGWKFPLSTLDMLMLASAFGKDAHKVMPFDQIGAAQATDEEVAAVHEQLLAEIQFD